MLTFQPSCTQKTPVVFCGAAHKGFAKIIVWCFNKLQSNSIGDSVRAQTRGSVQQHFIIHPVL